MPMLAPPSEAVQVQPLVVQAARLPDPAGDAAFSIVRLDPDSLSDASRLDDALTTVPGFSLYRRTSSLGANPTTQGVSLRGVAGSGASRALVTLDGVPQNDPFGGWVIWTALPQETVSGATVVRGAGAGSYGAGALTGVVALDEPTSISGAAGGELVGGDLGYGRASGIVETRAGDALVFLNASGETSDGWVPVRQGRGAADTPLSLHDWSAAARAQQDLGAAVLAGRVAAYEEDRGAGTLDANSRARGAQAGLTLAATPEPDRLGYRLQTWLEVSDLRNLSASVAANRQTATLANLQYATPAVGVGLNAALRQAAADYSLELGADVRDYDGQSRERTYSQGVASGTRVSGGGEAVAGLYTEASRSFGPWLLTGGARVDGWADYNSSLVQTGASPLRRRQGDRGGVTPSGRLGLKRDLGAGLYARTAAYTGFRPATLNELHRPFRVGNNVTEANAGLTPEKLYGAELGVGGSGPIDWDGDVFINQLANAITNVTIGKGPHTFPVVGYVPSGGVLYERENAGRINATGLELDGLHTISPVLTLRAAFTVTHARVDGGDQAPQLTGLRPALTPATAITAGADWRLLARLQASVNVRYEGSRFDDDLNTRKIAAGAGVDSRVSWRFNRGLVAYLAAENLFDAPLQTGRSAANLVTYDAPRLIRVGLKFSG